MNTVYRKTDKGDAAIAQRASELPPSLRRALILVDGKKTRAELTHLVRRMGDGDSEATLVALQANGLIEAIVAPADKSVEAQPKLADAAQAGPPPASSSPAGWFEATRLNAARHLTDKLGPTAEGLAVKIERAKTPDDLNELLTGAAQVLARVRGVGAGQEFAQRFLADASN